MLGNLVQIRERLAREDEEFKDLKKQHRSFEARLETLNRKSYLNERERIEEKELKKKKLVLKDRMEAIVRKHRTGPESRSAGN